MMLRRGRLRSGPLVVSCALALGAAACSRPPAAVSGGVVDAGTPLPTPVAPPSTAAPTSTEQTRALARRGEFPPGPEVNILAAKCAICHSTQYLATQRLTPAQWEKTLKKMTGWGAPIDEHELHALQRYLSVHFAPDTGAPVVVVVAAPAGALP